MKKLIIGPGEGFDNQIGHLISIMNLVRLGTLNVVKDLNARELDCLIDERANSIGSLLMHIGAMEFFVQMNVLGNNNCPQSEIDKWSKATANKLPLKLVKGFDLNYYISSLQAVRDDTIALLRKVKDEWLYLEQPFNDKIIVNNYFRVFHIAQDECSHLGQIIYIKKRLNV